MSSGKLTLSKLLKKVMPYASVEERIRAKKNLEEKTVDQADFAPSFSSCVYSLFSRVPSSVWASAASRRGRTPGILWIRFSIRISPHNDWYTCLFCNQHIIPYFGTLCECSRFCVLIRQCTSAQTASEYAKAPARKRTGAVFSETAVSCGLHLCLQAAYMSWRNMSMTCSLVASLGLPG